jgi:hypothetical protein
VDFHVTGDHKRRSVKVRSGEITVDGKPILLLSHDRFCREGEGWFAILRETDQSGSLPVTSDTWASGASDEWAWCPGPRDEIHPPQQLGDAMRAYLDMPIYLALRSPNPFVHSLAIIDRRIGRRTLQALEISEADHSLVRAMYRLRMQSLTPK